jgi:hypothetical protein
VARDEPQVSVGGLLDRKFKELKNEACKKAGRKEACKSR